MRKNSIIASDRPLPAYSRIIGCTANSTVMTSRDTRGTRSLRRQPASNATVPAISSADWMAPANPWVTSQAPPT